MFLFNKTIKIINIVAILSSVIIDKIKNILISLSWGTKDNFEILMPFEQYLECEYLPIIELGITIVFEYGSSSTGITVTSSLF